MLLGTEGGGKSNQRSLEDGKKHICERLIFMIHLEYPQLAEVQNLDFSNFFMKRELKEIKYLVVPIRDTHDQGCNKVSW